jgi:hypothetical protein
LYQQIVSQTEWCWMSSSVLSCLLFLHLTGMTYLAEIKKMFYLNRFKNIGWIQALKYRLFYRAVWQNVRWLWVWVRHTVYMMMSDDLQFSLARKKLILRLYSKSSLTLKEWRFNLSFPWVSILFVNSWRVSSHIVRYGTNPPAIQKQHWHSREALIEPPLIECEREWAFRIQAIMTQINISTMH